MPYPNEHAARVAQPSEFVENTFRRKVIARGISIVMGKKESNPAEMVVQAYRFNIRYFTAGQARDWLKDHDIEFISFEAATEKTEENATDPGERRIQNELKEEYRYVADQAYENRSVKTEGGEEQNVVAGVGIVYNSTTEIYPGVFESIAPGAFSESLSDFRTVKSFINHNPTKILSTTRSDPALEILDGESFLEFSAPIPPTTYGNDLIVNLKRGNIKGASFSFTIAENGDHYKKLSDGSLHRTITQAEIYEVGPVTNPAYEQTEVGLRNKDFFDRVILSFREKIVNDTELKEIRDFLSSRKGL